MEDNTQNNQEKPTREVKEDIITLRDVHKILWMCRDFEINHLWQRSIFLATFLTLLFTGYAFLFSGWMTFFHERKNIFSDVVLLSIGSLVVSLLGIIISSFWIMMAKGAKAWYEVYEKAICKIEGIGCEFSDNCPANYIKDKCANKERYCGKYSNDSVNLLRKEHLLHGQLTTDKSECLPEIDNRLFSTAGGGYSVSRINIAIGQVSLAVWCVIYIIHIILSCSVLIMNRDSVCGVGYIIALLLLAQIVLVLVAKHNKSSIKSSSL